jgi:predicted transcriptional regulator
MDWLFPYKLPNVDGESPVENEVINLAAKIVSAHIANNDISMDQLPGLIREVHRALATVGQGTLDPTVSQAALDPLDVEPAVAVRKSLFADHIICLNCGGSFKMLKRHIATDHQMTPEGYRARWGLPPSYPMVSAQYATIRSQLAKDNGLGRKTGAPAPKKRSGPKKG